MDLLTIIRTYNIKNKPSFDEVFRKLKAEYDTIEVNDSYDDFVRHVVKGWPGHVHGHQRRMPQKSLEQAVTAMRGFNWNLSPTTTFEELYADITHRFKDIPFCRGPLVCYDVSMRIGQLFGIEPQELVYLSNGALKGAKRLMGTPLSATILRSEVPAPLCNEPSIYIEDILCTFKEKL